MPYKRNTYFGNIKEAVATTLKGAQLTLRHLANAIRFPQNPPTTASDSNYFEDHRLGIVTLNYPYQAIPVPDNGRYRLHNEIDDCIVCDKCAKVCPVDCIDIEPIKSSEVIGVTLDGTPKRLYAAKFDIDMAKCCFCGLCTVVCPTECLTMTKTYDFSEFDLSNMNYHFATMTESEVETAQKAYQAAQDAKKAAVVGGTPTTGTPTTRTPTTETPAAKSPVFRPKVGARVVGETPTTETPTTETPTTETPTTETPIMETPKAENPIVENTPTSEEKPAEDAPKRPVFRPKIKPNVVGEIPTAETPIAEIPKAENPIVENTPTSEEKPADDAPKRPVFRPKIKPSVVGETPTAETTKAENPIVEKKDVVGETPTTDAPATDIPPTVDAPKRPVFRPKIRPKE